MKKAKQPKQHKVLIAVPTMATVPVGFLTSFVELRTNGMARLAVESNSLVYEARNHLAVRAVEAGCDYILWLDSDMIFPPDALLRLIEDAEKTGAEYVSGLYFTRAFPVRPMITKNLEWWQDEDGVAGNSVELYHDYPKDSLFEIAGGGFGCVLTSVQLIADVAEHFKGSPFAPLPTFGEDFSFCWRVKQLGRKMLCDSSVKCRHIGMLLFGEDTYLRTREKTDAE